MSNKLTLQDMNRLVMENPALREKYCQELTERGIVWRGRNKTYVNGKKVGIQKFVIAQKYAAASVYEEQYSPEPLPKKNKIKGQQSLQF